MENLSADDFSEKTAKGRCLVQFSAPWCGPCKAMEPLLRALDAETPDVTFFKINVEEAREIAKSHGIRAVPTFIYFKEGVAQSQRVGAQTKPLILSMLG